MHTRIRIALTAFMGLAFSLSAAGAIDFHRHWRIAQAERSLNRKHYEKARTEFKDLAETAEDPLERALLTGLAAIALGQQEGQVDQALQELAQIDHQTIANYALASLLAAKHDWQGIVERFGDAAIADWPEVQLRGPLGQLDMITHALVWRAEAFNRTGAYQQAEQDLEKAAEMCDDHRTHIQILRDLARLRQVRLNDPEGAYDANMQLVNEKRGGSIRFMAAIQAADFLVANGRHDEAVALIESLDVRDMGHTGWRGRIMLEVGRLWRDMGRPAEAAKVYQEVVVSDMEFTPEHRRKAAQEVAAALSAAGQTDDAIQAYQRLLEMPDLTDEEREQAEAALRADQNEDL